MVDGHALLEIGDHGDAEVHDLGEAVLIEDNVGGLDVAVDDAVSVGVVECAGELVDDGADLLRREGAALFDEALEVVTGQLLHDDEDGGVGLFAVEDLDDAGVAEGADDAGLVAEAIGKVALVDKRVGEHLDGDGPAERGVDALVNDGHAAARDLADQLVLSDLADAALFHEPLSEDLGEEAGDGGVLAEERQQGLAGDGDAGAVGAGDNVGGAGLAGEKRHLAEDVAGGELDEELLLSVFVEDGDEDLSRADDEHAVAGVAAAEDDVAGREVAELDKRSEPLCGGRGERAEGLDGEEELGRGGEGCAQGHVGSLGGGVATRARSDWSLRSMSWTRFMRG